MLVSRLPIEPFLSQHGAKLVHKVNPPDPTQSVVPYRDLGLPLQLRVQYELQQDGDFHRYARVDLIGSFESFEACSSALTAAELALRKNPAPGAHLSQPVGEKAQSVFVTAMSVPLGWVATQWDVDSRSVVNITDSWHVMKEGFVVRQVAAVSRSIFVTTFGEGHNLAGLFAWANGTYGGGGFKDLDYLVSRELSREKGFLPLPLRSPNGAFVTYWTGKQEEVFRKSQIIPNPMIVL